MQRNSRINGHTFYLYRGTVLLGKLGIQKTFERQPAAGRGQSDSQTVAGICYSSILCGRPMHTGNEEYKFISLVHNEMK